MKKHFLLTLLIILVNEFLASSEPIENNYNSSTNEKSKFFTFTKLNFSRK